MHPDLIPLVAGTGVVSRRSHPHLRHQIDAAVKAGELVAVLPGSYARPAVAGFLVVRARAVHHRDPDAVVTGPAAAHLLGWSVPYPQQMVVVTQRHPAPVAGIRWERRPAGRTPSRRHDGYRIASKAMIALDLCDTVDDALELALRHGVTREDLEATMAQSRWRAGNKARRAQLEAARDEPWSPLERAAHAHLRRGRVRGWQANRAIRDRSGELLGYGDLVFSHLHLVLELDSLEHHNHRRLEDAARGLRCARAGWEVIRLSSQLVLRTPHEFVATVRDIVATREAHQPSPRRPEPKNRQQTTPNPGSDKGKRRQ